MTPRNNPPQPHKKSEQVISDSQNRRQMDSYYPHVSLTVVHAFDTNSSPPLEVCSSQAPYQPKMGYPSSPAPMKAQ